jgi:spermidine synthase
VEDGCNHVVFAFQDRHFEPRWKWITSQARALEKHYGIELARIAQRIERNTPQSLRDPLTLLS